MSIVSSKKLILAVLVIVVILAFLAWLTFLFQANIIRGASAVIQKEKLDWQVQKEKSQKISQLEKELGDLEARKKEMEDFYVEKNNVLPLIKSLEMIANDTGNEIKINVADLTKIAGAKKKAAPKDDDDDAAAAKKSSSASKESSTKNTSSALNFKNNLGFTLETNGTYQNLVNFLIKMENLPYFIKIYSYNIEAVGKPKQATSASLTENPNELPENKTVNSSILIIVYVNE